jgi:hypothetical protein
MGSKNLRSLGISILLFIACQPALMAQNERVPFDSIFTRIVDAKLQPVKNASAALKQKPVIIVSTSHCSACVKYFAQAPKNYRFIFLMNYESLLEVERILNFYKLNGKNVYFTTIANIKNKKSMISSGPTPLAMYNLQNIYYFVDYPALNKASQEFTLNHNELKTYFKTEH